jgi:hypothetical protein
MHVYVTIRQKTCESLGVFTTYDLASHAVKTKIAEKGDAIEHVMSSEAEGWEQIETAEGEVYCIQYVLVDRFEGE